MASNRNVLKKYAPQARLDFIQAITNRAAQFGISKDGNAAGEVQGDLFILNGKAFPRSVANQRARLISRIARDGFGQVMEAVAYTWFNRFLAIRYMELHDYLDHGCRVLSNSNGHSEPEILEKATSVDFTGIDRDEIVSLKLDGTKDEQIYRKLLIAQCNDLHQAMPFLFEKIDDETELLLPEGLLQSDSIVRKLVNEIAEQEWQEIEIIGWLYQFYISEKKDQVIGKVVKSEDIPAATQLFTPKQLDPEAITLIDPAVGSGHILVEAYDLFRAIYLERGYTKREAARAILTKNLFGLDIDDRAAQMAGFALLMKACADDRSVLRNAPKLNVLALQDGGGLDVDALAKALLPHERFELLVSGDLLPETLVQPTLMVKESTSAEAKAIKALVALFDGAKTFGSLITVPNSVMQSLPLLDALLAKSLTSDLLLRRAQEDAQEALKPLVEQARLLGGLYDCVVANPPYMGSKGMNADLKAFAGQRYPNSKSDLFAIFIERGFGYIRDFGHHSMVTMQSWMFLSSFEKMRELLLGSATLEAMAHMGNGVMGIAFGTAATNFRKAHFKNAKGIFCWVENDNISSDKPEMWPPENERNSKAGSGGFFRASASDFEKIPGSPIAYWVSNNIFRAFQIGTKLHRIATPRAGMITGNNADFVRFHYEVSQSKIGYNYFDRDSARISGKRWFPYQKGGPFRKYAGNIEHVVDWENDGFRLRTTRDNNGKVPAHAFNEDYIFKYNVNWSAISSGNFSCRITESGCLFDASGSAAFPNEQEQVYVLSSFLNSPIAREMIGAINPTLNFQAWEIGNLPIIEIEIGKYSQAIIERTKQIRSIAKQDWDSYETSFDFQLSPILSDSRINLQLKTNYQSLREFWLSQSILMQCLEEENNRLFIEAYGLQDELTPDVPLSEVTLTCNPHYRYGGEATDEQREARLKSDTMRELASYAVGCMMGRYSLAERGLIYAHAGGDGFDPSRYGAFPADDDGIIPLTEEHWFADDAAVRIEEFLGIAWPEAPVMETMATLMDGLSMEKAGEPRAALRSYLSKQFYKDHLQTYNNRPIYWLFSSGKQKAFEALVYLHRYNEGTLARMRTVYVTPLMGKLQQRMADLEAEIAASSSSAEKTRKTREKDTLAKQVVELRTFDEELRHLADQRITLDLDDGVKVNYARFGNLLAFKDKVCPKKKGEDE